MTDNPDNRSDGRMLLSHNFSLSRSQGNTGNNSGSTVEVHSLNREQFAKVFIEGLDVQVGVSCTAIDNPHWVVEVSYDADRYSAKEVGQLCADTLAQYRIEHKEENFYVMALGGVKTTPPTGKLPSLQTGEWGVDMVETASPEEFLEEINWDKLAGAKPAEAIFRIDHPV